MVGWKSPPRPRARCQPTNRPIVLADLRFGDVPAVERAINEALDRHIPFE
jgi:hypothetical protein